MLEYLPEQALPVEPTPNVGPEEENYNLIDWLLETPDLWRTRKCVLCSLCFGFLLYPSFLLGLLVCSETCFSLQNDVSFQTFIYVMVGFLALTTCFLSTLCMMALYAPDTNQEPTTPPVEPSVPQAIEQIV